MFWCVSYYFGAFGTIWLPYKTQFKMSRSGEKFVPRSRVGTFRNERNRSTPLDSKIMFWCVLYYLDAFGTVWLPYKTQWKTGRTCAKVHVTKSRQNFSQRTHLIHPKGLYTHVLACFVLFGFIWYRLVKFQNLVQNGLKWCKSSCHEVVLEFFTTNHSIDDIGP